MKTTKKTVVSASDANTTKANESLNNVGANLPQVEIEDDTQTKGKATAKFNINAQTELENEVEKIDKNKLFAEVTDYFCPVKFNDTELRNNLQPLVTSGILSTDAMEKAIATAKNEFLSAHVAEIEKANNLTFAEVLQKLQENKTLYKKVLTACNIAELKESDYITDGKVCIYRASQCLDKEGNNRYCDVSLSKVVNGKTFTQNLFAEYREVNTSNILLSIRYRQSFLDASKRLLNKISDYNKILTYVAESAKKAKENGFTKEQIIAEIEKVF